MTIYHDYTNNHYLNAELPLGAGGSGADGAGTPATGGAEGTAGEGGGKLSGDRVEERGNVPLELHPDHDPASRLDLTDFINIRTLQELQDGFSSLTQLHTTFQNADGKPLTQASDPASRDENDRVLDWLMADELGQPSNAPLVAPIIVEGQVLGSITVNPHQAIPNARPSLQTEFLEKAKGMGLSAEDAQSLYETVNDSGSSGLASAIQFLYLMANHVARLCYQEHQLQKRIDELSTLYTLSTLLSQQRDLQKLLDTATRETAQTFHLKAAGIRLLDEAKKQLHIRSIYNLSPAYLQKGPIVLEQSKLFQQALSEGIAYVADMQQDARVLYPEQAQREGLCSLLCAGIIFKNEPIGVIQIFSAEQRQFSRWEVNLLRAIAQLLATAIHNQHLEAKRLESAKVNRQLRLAVDVQKRMLPDSIPNVAGFDIAARYLPSLELGGDFYDFLDFSGNLGIAIADVAGKGIAAALFMAAVRSSLRAYAQDLYDIDTIVSRVNAALCRDTKSTAFATLFYGVLDTKSRRLTYCNAGHEPPLLLRQNTISRLHAGGMVVGVDPQQKYDKGILDIQKGDAILLFTDGLMDAMNFDRQRFGRQRIIQAFEQTQNLSAKDGLNHILWEMRRFAGLNPRMDDNTMLLVKCVS